MILNLKKDGFDIKCKIKNNPKDVIDEFKNGFVPDLLITDIFMPEKNRIDLVKELKDQNFNFDSIVITVYPNYYNKLAASDAEINDYIVKPFSYETFKKLVVRYIDKFEK